MAYASKIIMTQGDAPLKPSTGTIAIYAKSDNGFYIKDDQNVETEIKYTHPTSDGNLHVPANSTINSGKVLTAGASAGTYTWEAAATSNITRINKTEADTPYTITTSNCSGTVIFTNTGATAAVSMLLPAGADGYRITAIISAAYDFSFVANGTETIRYLSTVSKAGGSIKSASIGDELQLDWNGTQWVANVLGTGLQLETS